MFENGNLLVKAEENIHPILELDLDPVHTFKRISIEWVWRDIRWILDRGCTLPTAINLLVAEKFSFDKALRR
jgi:hypothetical protein